MCSALFLGPQSKPEPTPSPLPCSAQRLEQKVGEIRVPAPKGKEEVVSLQAFSSTKGPWGHPLENRIQGCPVLGLGWGGVSFNPPL